MKKFFLGILTSSNEKLLQISYYSAKHQCGHNIDYTIFIIVNSTDNTYYNRVKETFKLEDVIIIKTNSNGKPGMGHNSVINVFRNHKAYDYMLLLDGDDFLYPCALHQLSKCFDKVENIDMLMMKSTDKLNTMGESPDLFDVNLNNNFSISCKLYVDYKLYPWNKEHMRLSNCFENSLCTPLRLFLLHRRILEQFDGNLFEENCSLYDDYLTFLYFIRFCQNPDLKCFIIPGKYIYLYNSINVNSATHNDNNNNDMAIYNQIKNKFYDCYQYLTPEWDITKLPTMYISHYIDMNYEYKINENLYALNMSVNINDLYNDPNNKYIKNFGIQIVNDLLDMYYKMVYEYFETKDYKNVIKYSEIYNVSNIKNPHISFMFLFGLYIENKLEFYNQEIIKNHILNSKNII